MFRHHKRVMIGLCGVITLRILFTIVDREQLDNHINAIFHHEKITSVPLVHSQNATESLATVATSCIQRSRQQRLREACTLHNDDVTSEFKKMNPFTYRRLLVDVRHKVLYCVNPKVGGTSWKTMMILQNSENRSQTMEMIRKGLDIVHSQKWLNSFGLYWLSQLPMVDIQKKLNTYYKFMITRQPFDRLVSAYVNKFVEHTMKHFTPPGAKLEQLRDFLDILTMTSDDLTNRTENMTIGEQRKWGHFQNLPHWHAQLTLCHPCFIQYDYIAKLETIDDDQLDILPHIDAGDRVLATLNRMTNQPNSKGTAGYHETIASYENLGILLQRYQMDFDAFGYDPKTIKGSGCELDPDSNVCC